MEPEEIDVPLRVVPPTVSNDIPNHLRTPTSQFLAPSHIMQVKFIPFMLFQYELMNRREGR